MAAVGLAASAVALLGHGLLGVALVAAGVAALLSGRWRAAPSDLPTAAVLVVAATVAVGVALGAFGLPALASVAGSRLTIAAGGVAVAALGVWGRAGVRTEDRDPLPWGHLVPALAMAAYGLVWQAFPIARRSEWFLGADHVRHVIYVADLRHTGFLQYETESYPRAWHTLVALLWSADGSTTSGPGLRDLISLMTPAVWFLYALVVLATSVVAFDLGARLGLRPRDASLAGLAAGAFALWPTFAASFLTFGFQTSILGALLLAVSAREVLRSSNGARAVLVTGAGLLAILHTWQLLAPAAVLAFLHAAWTYLRGGGRRRWALVLGVALGVGAVAFPALVAVVRDVGIQHSTDADVNVALPVGFLVASVLGCLLLLIRGRTTTRTYAVMVLGTAVSAVVLAGAVGISPTTYYPAKVLWHSALLGLPGCAVLALRGARVATSTWRSGMAASMVKASWVVGALLTAGCLLSPLQSFGRSWSYVQGAPVLNAVTTTGAARAQVVWLGGGPRDDVIARILLDFYRAGDTAERTPQQPLTVAEDCALLAAAERPTVLSSRPLPEVRARYACVRDLSVVPVRDTFTGG